MPNPKAARKAAKAQLASPDAVKKCLSGDALQFAIQQIKEHAKTAPKPLSIANQEHRAYTRMAAMQYAVLMFQIEVDLRGNKFSVKQNQQYMEGLRTKLQSLGDTKTDKMNNALIYADAFIDAMKAGEQAVKEFESVYGKTANEMINVDDRAMARGTYAQEVGKQIASLWVVTDQFKAGSWIDNFRPGGCAAPPHKIMLMRGTPAQLHTFPIGQ